MGLELGLLGFTVNNNFCPVIELLCSYFQPSSPRCSGNGRYVCGICECNADWAGPTCSIAIIPPGCGDGLCSGKNQ